MRWRNNCVEGERREGRREKRRERGKGKEKSIMAPVKRPQRETAQDTPFYPYEHIGALAATPIVKKGHWFLVRLPCLVPYMLN